MSHTMVKDAYFYHLRDAQKDSFICRIADHYYEHNNKVFILVGSDEHAVILDRLLWTFKQLSFIPHEIIDTYTSCPNAPVVICPERVNVTDMDVLVVAKNITVEDSDFLNGFPVIIDFADLWDNALVEESRRRYKLIKELGFTMHSVEQFPF